MDARQLLNNLLDEITEDENALREKKTFAKQLRERIDREDAKAGETDSPEKRTVLLMRRSRPATFFESVEKAVRATAGEYTASDVFGVLASDGVKMESATPKASISTALARLEKNGVIEMTFKGGGNVPNRYRTLSSETGAETESATG